MALVSFGYRVDMYAIDPPLEVGAYIVAYDLDGVLKQKDHLGNVTLVGAGAGGPQGPAGPVGPAGLTWSGPWIATQSYSKNYAVGYASASWWCISDVVGATSNTGPNVDTTHWALLAAQGSPGSQGGTGSQGLQGPQGEIGINWLGDWIVNVYDVRDAVYYNGSSYVCIASTVGSETISPDTNTACWDIISLGGNTGPQGATGSQGPQGVTGPAGVTSSVILQNTYDNSTDGQIILDTTRGALKIKGASASTKVLSIFDSSNNELVYFNCDPVGPNVKRLTIDNFYVDVGSNVNANNIYGYSLNSQTDVSIPNGGKLLSTNNGVHYVSLTGHTSFLGNQYAYWESSASIYIGSGTATNGRFVVSSYGGTVSLIVNESGNVGIGLVPSSKLHVGVGSGGISTGIILQQQSENASTPSSYTSIDFIVPTTGLIGQFLSTANNYTADVLAGGPINLLANSTALANYATSGQVAILAGGTNGIFTINTGGLTASTERFRINSTGNVIIGGSNSTSTKLFINSATSSTTIGSNVMLDLYNSSDAGVSNMLSELGFSAKGQPFASDPYNNGHRFAIISGYVNQFNNLTSGGGLIFSTRETTSSSLTERVRITHDGRVGIGTSPSTKLHVYATQSGVFRLEDGTQGNGYILTSDNNGVGSWTSSSFIVGSGTASYIPVFSATGSISNSSMYETNSYLNISKDLYFTNSLIYFSTTSGINITNSNGLAGGGYVAIGYNAVTGNSGIAIGWYSNNYNQEGVAVGYSAIAGYASVAVGFNSNSIGGSDQGGVYIGYNAQGNGGGTNEIVIGLNAIGNGTNTITLGNNTISSLYCNTNYISSISDLRDKTNIIDIPVGLDYINSLRPVKFDWNRRDNSMSGLGDIGFIAQELDTVEQSFSNEIDSKYTRLVNKNNPDRYTATPMATYPILVKAVQELSQQVKDLQAIVDGLTS